MAHLSFETNLKNTAVVHGRQRDQLEPARCIADLAEKIVSVNRVSWLFSDRVNCKDNI
jgi:hypothetical protein